MYCMIQIVAAKCILVMVSTNNVVKAGSEGEPKKGLGHGSTRSNRSNRWLDRIIVGPKREAIDG